MSNSRPYVCDAVRTVGIVKPQFDPAIKGFHPPQLRVDGTGFWLKNYELFITCSHVVQNILGVSIDIAGMLVVGGNGVEYRKASIAAIDFLHDLAVLNIEADNEFIKQQVNTGLEITDREISISENIAYAGFPLGNELLNSRHSPTYSEGIIGSEILEDTIPKMIQISGPVTGGYSGGPIVSMDEPWRILAVVANSPSQQAGNASIFRGIHWKHLKALCELMRS
ncbi:MAG: trypsin-like peptidase domain-containing protein [Deltaproteobacteria bacterium]|nr:trypsin-like peptidase domain-containing protein [Deltaproteobacteria bacterium]